MAGKHRKRSEVRTTVAKRGGSGVAAAALSITGLSTAVVTGTTAAVAPNVQLMALVSAANSTSQFFAGSSYYGTDWAEADLYGQQEVVPFFRGPNGIAEAINDVQTGDNQTGVTASGWGAGQAGTALGIIAEGDNPELLDSIGLVILDNNTNRAGGGFWTTYYPFAPLLFTTADPTPTNLPGLTVLDVGYEYNINGDAAVDPANPFAIGNSLAAYAYGYAQESTALDITQEDDGGDVILHEANGDDTVLEPGTHYVVKDGNIVGEYSADGTTANPNNSTIYVTVQTDDLPLTRPFRLFPGGDILANALDPTLTDLVNAGYNDGLGLDDNPAIPEDPTVLRPMKPFSSLSALDADGVQESVQEGATAGAQTAFANIANPGNFITKPLGEVGKLPSIPGLSSLTNLTAANNSVASAGARNGSPTVNAGPSSLGSDRPRPLKKIADSVSSSLKKLAGGAEQKTESGDDED